MRKVLLLILMFSLVGCAEKIKSYINDPQSFIRDPHFTEYKGDLDTLESSYLQGEIDYVDYLKQKEQRDEDYARDVLNRENIIHDD